MINIIKAEFQKAKRASINKFIIITPLFTILLSFLLGGGQNGAYNWWYTMFLPAMIAIISAQTITREEKLSYKGLLLYPQNKGSIWIGKIIYVAILLIFSSLIFMIGIIGIGLINQTTILLNANILATVALIVTLLFNIPLSLLLTVKFNMFVTILFNIILTTFGVVSFGSRYFSVFYPYGISSALMVPILHILPNGLPVPVGSSLLDVNISVGIGINILIFLALTVLSTIWFRNKEVS